MTTELLIKNGNNIYQPIIKEGIIWTTERKGVPGKLTFTVIKDSILDITEGNHVSLKIDGYGIFYGYIFTKKRNKEQHIEITAYDQLRYLKNKETYIYENKTAGELVKMIAGDFNLKLGTITDTKFKIASRVESDTTLFDAIGNALDLTLMNSKEMYVLFDDFGDLTLKSLENMRLNILIDEETGENFDYTSTIDEQTYNVIKYVYTNKETSETKVAFSPKSKYENGKQLLSETQRKWGILQYFLKEENNVNEAQAQAKADALLSLYNVKTRKLKITKVFGDSRVRAGSLIAVMLDLGDVIIKNYMLVEKCVHTFNESEHFMDLTLRGGEFVG